MPRWMCGPLGLLMVLFGTAALSAQALEVPKIGVFDPETIWKLTEVGKKYNQDLNDARDRLQGDIDHEVVRKAILATMQQELKPL